MLIKPGYHLLLDTCHDSYIWSQAPFSFHRYFVYLCITALIPTFLIHVFIPPTLLSLWKDGNEYLGHGLCLVYGTV